MLGPAVTESIPMPPPTARKISPAVQLALIYGGFGAVWIVLSDAALAILVPDATALTVLQTWKGWLFVAASAVLIMVAGARILRVLDTAEHRYRLLFADNPQPMALYDPATGRFVEANTAACRQFGYQPDEMVGMPFLDLVVPEQRPEARRIMERARVTTEDMRSTRAFRCRDGRVVQIEVNGNSVLYDNRVMRLIVMQDVTARLQAEGALIRTLDRLARQEADRGQLAHALAHDLREPVRQVAGFVQLLERRYQGQLGDEADQYIGFATEGVHRLNELLSDLHRFTEIRSLELEEVEVGAVLSDVMTTLAPQIDACAPICVGEMPSLRTDQHSLSAVFAALLENALKFRVATAPCRVEVAAAPLGSDWCFSVKDNGIGVEPEYRDAIFQLFGRLHTRDRIPGNGTGLALARKLVEAAGGRIWLDEDQGDGSTFRFTLPARPPREAARH